MIKIDKRSRLEVADTRHRYGKNLRLYYDKYLEISGLKGMDDLSYDDKNRLDSFFQWLNSTEVELPECSKKLLEEDVVEYLNTEHERSKYEVRIDSQGLFRHVPSGELLDTMQKKWLFVQRGESMFASEKRILSPRLHHSSFFGGGDVHAAVLVRTHLGELKELFPHSGHYRPQDSHLCLLLEYLQGRHVDLEHVHVDVQRVFKVSRFSKDGSKGKKVDSLWMVNGLWVLHFLRHKQKMVSSGLLDQLTIRHVDNTTGMDRNLKPSEIKKSKMKMDTNGLSPRLKSCETILVIPTPSKLDRSGHILESTSKLDFSGISSCIISDKSGGGHTDLFPYIV
mmetsp:Transcript_7360/g.10966  ORF Transcript_7360/g.10966 Transcript_7360/m.10966 type:complete len:338 (-) Transcript_7360:1185-2198(-)